MIPIRTLAGLCALSLAPLPALATGPDRSAEEVHKPAFPVRIAKLDADVTLAPEKGSLAETVSLSVEGQDLGRLDFAIDEGLVVTSCRASGGYAEYHQAGSELGVDLIPPVTGATTLTFSLKGVPHLPSEIGPARAVLSPAAAWYPVHPGMWGAATVIVRVPEGWGAIAPGTPDARMSPGVFRYATEKPVRSVAVAAGPGLKIASSTLVQVPFRLASVGAKVEMKDVAARLTPPMSWLAGALVPYPFDGFELVLLPGYARRVQGSGIFIAGQATPLYTDADGADLLAGQWFGERLAGDAGWITGMAAWLACVFAEDRTLPMPTDVAAQREGYFHIRSGDVALAHAPATTPDPVLRGKGSAAPAMVRLVAGNRTTFDAIRSLFAAPIGPPISIDDVRKALERLGKRPFDRVFTDWFERSGAPELEVALRSMPSASGGFRADVTLTQKTAAYEMPVDIVIYGPGDEHRETVEIDSDSTAVFYILPFEPKRIELDPLGRIYRRK